MANWQPIETAPLNGTPIQAEIPNNGSDNVIAFLPNYVDEAGDDCGAWSFVSEQEPPDCWTDGVCWDLNEDGKPSVKPVRWKPLPSGGSE
jgi:hypothetical protein